MKLTLGKEDGMQSKISALLIMPRERRLPLLEHLEACGVDLLTACDCGEAHRILDGRRPVQVVLTDVKLTDGDWRSVLAEVSHSDKRAEVIVCASLVDHNLWIDALEGGAYDVIVRPYQREEVRRILVSAAARSDMRSLDPARGSQGGISLAGRSAVV